MLLSQLSQRQNVLKGKSLIKFLKVVSQVCITVLLIQYSTQQQISVKLSIKAGKLVCVLLKLHFGILTV